jgi:hypothetical protein
LAQVWAIDLLGFGHSVKEPITYTQYLWQDQVTLDSPPIYNIDASCVMGMSIT